MQEKLSIILVTFLIFLVALGWFSMKKKISHIEHSLLSGRKQQIEKICSEGDAEKIRN